MPPSGGVQPFLLEDIYRQAATRGGREFDSILAGKVVFKQTANVAGDVALVGAVAAAGYAANNNDRNAAVAAGAFNLPDRVYAATLQLPETVSTVNVDFTAPEGGPVLDSRKADIWRAGPCGIAWVRYGSGRLVGPRAPNSAPAAQMAMPVVIPPLPAVATAAPPSQPGKPDAKSEDAAEASPLNDLKSGFTRLFGAPSAAAAPAPATEENNNMVSK
jgi:hypothetical protein